MDLSRRQNESPLDYHKRIIYGKLGDKSLGDLDYSELSDYAYGQHYSSDVARRMFYGSKRTLDLVASNQKDSHASTNTINELDAKIDEFNAKVEELNETISTLNTEKEEVSTKYEEVSHNFEEATNNLEQLNSELDELKNYKHEVELNEKMSVIEQYTTTLNEEVLNDYRAKVDEFTAEELDMRLAYELKKSNPSVFSKNPTPYIPKEVEPKGIEAILAKYQK